MYTISSNSLSFSVDENGFNASVKNLLTGHEYIKVPGEMWKMLYSEGQRAERPIYGRNHKPVIAATDSTITLTYDGLHSDDRELDIKLVLNFVMTDELSVTAHIENHSDVPIKEFQLTAVSGVQSIDGNPESDYLIWPYKLGKKILNPAFTDLATLNGFRVYEMPEFEHTDLNIMYPGTGSMQWYDWGNDNEGLYVGSHDATHQTICLRVERTVTQNTLRLGVIRYPFAEPGESWDSEPIVYYAHEGSWHKGAKRYRKWLAESGTWRAPEIPDWARDFQGWLRLIMKPHHCEVNWDYHEIPSLFDKTQEAGFNTLFLMGWEQGGFARLWPDFEVAEDMGGREVLQKGIDYVHEKGGKVILFLSYYLIDHQSRFYKNEGGDKCTIRTIWNEDLPFAETYCGEGTYRKICQPPMPMYAACPGSDRWHEKMKEVTKYCMDLGVDGVLYDLGGRDATFCFSNDHAHKKPNYSYADKDKRYEDLRRLVKSYGDDKVMLQEYNVDIYGQHMDIIHSSLLSARSNKLPAIYRYTFPELIVTNRGMAMDERKYKDNINFTFIMGLSYDLSIYRCLGLPENVPNYINYMKEVLKIRYANAEYLIRGTFVDDDGFTVDSPDIRAEGYRAADGSLGVALWNWGKETVTFTVKGENNSVTATLDADTVGFVKL